MKVTIIIVNWNTGKLLGECLQSIASLPEKESIAEVIVVDNLSSDDSFSSARKIEIGVPMLMAGLPENVGFAKANNFGMRRRRNKDTHVLLLNPDTIVKAGAIAAGLQELETNSKAAVVGLRLLNPDGSLQHSVRNFPSFKVMLWLFLRLRYFFPKAALWQEYMQTNFDYGKKAAVEQVMGAVFFIRKETIDALGMLDEKFWVWFEEVDFCKRVIDADWQVLYTPAGEVIHYGGTSFNQWVGLKKAWPFLKSGLYYARKHFSSLAWVVLIISSPLSLLLAIPASLRHLLVRTTSKATL